MQRERAEMGESEGSKMTKSVRSKNLWRMSEKAGEIGGGSSMFEIVTSVVKES